MIDASEVSDQQIMRNTKTETANGRFRFLTKLPSGRDVESPWKAESDKRKGVLAWVDAVRAEIVADAQEAQAQAKRRYLEERQSQQGSAPALIVGPDSKPIGPAGSTPLTTLSSTPAGQGLSSDPRAFVEGQLAAQTASVERLRSQYKEVSEALRVAHESMLQWRAILASLSSSSQSEKPATTPTTKDSEA